MTPYQWCGRTCSVFLLAAVALLQAASAASAEQFVLFDVTFTFTKEDADNSKPSKSHYYVTGKTLNADRPKDWTHPVDYRNGTVHIRTEVLSKPAGDEPTTWSLCYKGRPRPSEAQASRAMLSKVAADVWPYSLRPERGCGGECCRLRSSAVHRGGGSTPRRAGSRRG